MYIPPLSTIRTMPCDTVEQALALEQTCMKALLMRPKSEAEHAELLYLYAGAIAFTQERRAEASPFAYRAFELAFGAQEYVLAMKARCMNVYCNARGLLLKQFWGDVAGLQHWVNTSWTTDLGLTESQIKEVQRCVTDLEEYGDRLTKERTSLESL